MSRGMSGGGCGLRKSLGSLSADGWGCVPALLVVWPEASQHWSLQAVGWGQALVPRSQARRLPPARVHINDHSSVCQPPAFMILERATAAPCLPRRPSKTSREVWPRLLWSHCFCPQSQCTQDLVYALQEWSLCFPQSCGAPTVKPPWPSKPNALGLLLPVPDP